MLTAVVMLHLSTLSLSSFVIVPRPVTWIKTILFTNVNEIWLLTVGYFRNHFLTHLVMFICHVITSFVTNHILHNQDSLVLTTTGAKRFLKFSFLFLRDQISVKICQQGWNILLLTWITYIYSDLAQQFLILGFLTWYSRGLVHWPARPWSVRFGRWRGRNPLPSPYVPQTRYPELQRPRPTPEAIGRTPKKIKC